MSEHKKRRAIFTKSRARRGGAGLVIAATAFSCFTAAQELVPRLRADEAAGFEVEVVAQVDLPVRTFQKGTSIEPGTFRTRCEVAYVEHWDPLDLKADATGYGATSHWHTFFGAVGVERDATPETLREAPASTCSGGLLNRTLYWFPSLMDRTKLPIEQGPNGVDQVDDTALAALVAGYQDGTGESPFVNPDIGWMYYKGADGSHCGPRNGRPAVPGCFTVPANLGGQPANLRMIADLPNQPVNLPSRAGVWKCSDQPGRKHRTLDDMAAGPGCPTGSYLNMSVPFPTCWNGVDWQVETVAGIERQTHVVYENDANADGVLDEGYWRALSCPASHPITLPQISIEARWLMRPGMDVDDLVLSSDLTKSLDPETTEPVPDGSTAHGDWMNGWDLETATAWWTECLGGGPNNGVNNTTIRSCVDVLSTDGDRVTSALGSRTDGFRIVDETAGR